ncbi:MAG: hypothetical protein M3440_09855 [Chloroflexota bacterium]|nr:hypothetical protein [Chloroflexota bacterium]
MNGSRWRLPEAGSIEPPGDPVDSEEQDQPDHGLEESDRGGEGEQAAKSVRIALTYPQAASAGIQ